MTENWVIEISSNEVISFLLLFSAVLHTFFITCPLFALPNGGNKTYFALISFRKF